MDVNSTMLCASGAAYNIQGTEYTPVKDELYDPNLNWTTKPVAFTGGINDIDACFVAQNDTGIIVSSRGTLSSGNSMIDDWLNDFYAEPTVWSYPFTQSTTLPGLVHAGFYGAVQNIYEGVQTQVQSLLKTSPAPVYVTGHSKGGGMAPLIAYLLEQNGIPVEQIVTFAAPKPGNGDFQTAYQSVFAGSKHTRFENYSDLIPFLWPSDADDYLILQGLVDLLNEFGWTTLAQDIASAENWNYQPVGTELYIGLSDGQQVVSTNPGSAKQGFDLITNLGYLLYKHMSLETALFTAHTISCCINSTPVVGYLSEVCPEIAKPCPLSDPSPKPAQIS